MTAARPIRAHAGTVEHRAIIDDRVPPLPPPHSGRPMCAAWSDHELRGMQDAINGMIARAQHQCCLPAFETLGRAHAVGCPTGVLRS